MRISLRRTLLLTFAGLIVLLALALVSLSRREETNLVRNLAVELLQRNQDVAQAVLRDLFEPIRTELAVNVRRIRAGQVAAHDPVALKDLLLPRLQHMHGVGSMMVGDADGYQCLLMRYDELVTRSPLLADLDGLPDPDPSGPQYLTREFHPGRWGATSRWTIWDPGGREALARFERELPDYDPRTRPWHRRAVERLAELEARADPSRPTSAADHVAWTGAYELFTSKTPGISASAAARDPEGEVVIVAYDVLLDDISSFTRAQRPTPRGQVFVTTDDGLVLGLPEDRRFASGDERLKALLQPLREVGGEMLARWDEVWKALDERAGPFTFESGGETWWGSGVPFRLDDDRSFHVGLVLPRSDLLELISHDPRRLWWAAAVGLGFALLITQWVARRVTRPLDRLIARSRRIGALDLTPGSGVVSPLAEIQDLDRALETMRARLAQHIEERERTADALIESEERFRSTFDLSAVGVVHTSLEGELLLVNETMARMLGRPAEELCGLHFADITHPDELEAAAAHARRMLSGESESETWEKRYPRPDGSWFWAQISITLRRDDAGRPLHFISVIQDVSERRALEQQLLQSQKLEAVGRLAGGVAHDFNNLLTVVKGYASLVHAGLAPEAPSRRHLEHVLRAVEGGEGLTRQLLAFARKSQGQPRVVDAGTVVRDVAVLLLQLIGEDVTLETEIEPGVHPVHIDPVQLQQVLVNLVVNARDALTDGGHIDVAVRGAEGGEVLVEVRDDGVGMDAEVVRSIFDPFFTTKPVGKGTGLGLATCYGIAEEAGGRLDVVSAPGEGSTFTLRLPRSSAPIVEDLVPVGLATETRAAVILVAEDDEGIRELLDTVLREASYTVHTARHGEEALERAAELVSLDLLITDVVMPGLDGGELARALRRERPDLPVLFVSGYAREQLGDRIPADTELILKPFVPEEILARVRSVLAEPLSPSGGASERPDPSWPQRPDAAIGR